MIFSKISTPSLKEACVQALLVKIISGELKPGDYLPPERELAAMMGVSRSSVNQSLLELESMGFLEMHPRRGTVICDYRKHPTPGSLAALMKYGSVEMDYYIFSDLMDTRLLIEAECARLACENIYDSTLEQMQTLANALQESPDDPTEIIYQYHYHLTQASGNGVYTMIFRGFESVLRTLIHQHYCIKGTDLHEAARLHGLLLDAIRAKDKPLAEQRIRDILSQGVSALGERYE